MEGLSQNGWWSSFGKKKTKKKTSKVHTLAHDDLVRRQFSADAPNHLWPSDITEHPTREGKLNVCAIKDMFSNRIVGYCIDERMKAQLAVATLNNAVVRRGDVAGCVFFTGPRIAVSFQEGPSDPGQPSHGGIDGSYGFSG